MPTQPHRRTQFDLSASGNEAFRDSNLRAMTADGVIKGYIYVERTVNVGSLNDAAGETVTVEARGVERGDMVLGVSYQLTIRGLTVTAYVSAENEVSIRFQNESGGTVDLIADKVRILVLDIT